MCLLFNYPFKCTRSEDIIQVSLVERGRRVRLGELHLDLVDGEYSRRILQDEVASLGVRGQENVVGALGVLNIQHIRPRPPPPFRNIAGTACRVDICSRGNLLPYTLFHTT